MERVLAGAQNAFTNPGGQGEHLRGKIAFTKETRRPAINGGEVANRSVGQRRKTQRGTEALQAKLQIA